MKPIERWQLAILTAAAVATLAIRLVFGPFSLQGVIYLGVTAIAAAQFGPAAAAVSTVLGLIAAHVRIIIDRPSILRDPAAMFTRQYISTLGIYLTLSAILYVASKRHYRLVGQLEREREDREQLDSAYKRELEASLIRETVARREAEQAGRAKEVLLEQIASELRLARELAAIVESSDDAIVAKDLSGVVTSWNRAADQTFGHTAIEMIGRSIRRIVPDERVAEEDNVLVRVQRGEKIVQFETVRQRKDGTLIPISLTASPIHDESGRVVGVSEIARNITDRKRAESALADLQQRLLALVSASGVLLRSPQVADVVPATLTVARDLVTADGYAIWRRERDTNRWHIMSSAGISETFARESAWTDTPAIDDALVVEDVRSLPLLSSRQDAYRAEGVESILVIPLAIGGQNTANLVFYYRTRHSFTDVEVQAARALGNLAATALTTAELYDAQQQSRGESEFLAEAGAVLARSLDYETTLKEVAKLAVPQIADWCAIDLVGAGNAIQRLAVAHRDPAKAALAKEFRERYPDDPNSRFSVTRVIRTGEPALLERLPDPSAVAPERRSAYLEVVGTLGIKSVMIVPLLVRQRTVGAMTFVAAESGRHYNASDLQLAKDVASRAALAVDNARAYAEARRASQLKDEFLATLSHELRTPLNAIVGYARLLRAEVLSDERKVRAFEILERNATSLTQIVEDVLDVSRIIAGKVRLHVQPVELGSVVELAEASVRPAADAKGVRIQMSLDRDTPAVSGDPDRLQQVVWNLLANAVKFTPRAGLVQIELAQIESHVEIVVRDTGRGIPRAFLPHVFERFRQADSGFSREHGGLGLGLAICRDIVELHGGTIHAESDGEGTGATFRVTLPSVEARADGARREPRVERRRERETVPASSKLDGVRVLAVDDEEDTLTLLREILEGAGAAVTTVTSAEEALDMVHRSAPDVLIADIGMPGTDGFELILRVRALTDSRERTIPAAALTAYARSEDRVRTLRAGFQVHLAKPIDPEELVAAIADLARHVPTP